MSKFELANRIMFHAYSEGDFVLRSGKRSKYYLDKYMFETRPQVLTDIGAELAKHVSKETTLIAGAELGGIALAVITSLISTKPWILIRNKVKSYGTKNMIEGTINEGDVVLLVEDIATSGGQVLEAAAIIKERGARVEKIVAVIDRMQGARENIEKSGYVFESLLTKEDLGIKD